jgi:hypothetical protein
MVAHLRAQLKKPRNETRWVPPTPEKAIKKTTPPLSQRQYILGWETKKREEPTIFITYLEVLFPSHD